MSDLINKLDPDVIVALTSSGWKCPLGENAVWLNDLRDRGFSIVSHAAACLTLFGGCSLTVANDGLRKASVYERVLFDPRQCSLELTRIWEDKTQREYTPLGIVDDHADLLIDENEQWYLAFGGLWRIGENANEAIRHLLLCCGSPVEVIAPGRRYRKGHS